MSEISLNADKSYLEIGGNCYSIQELLRVNTIQKFSEVGSSLVRGCHVEAKRFLNLVWSRRYDRSAFQSTPSSPVKSCPRYIYIGWKLNWSGSSYSDRRPLHMAPRKFTAYLSNDTGCNWIINNPNLSTSWQKFRDISRKILELKNKFSFLYSRNFNLSNSLLFFSRTKQMKVMGL